MREFGIVSFQKGEQEYQLARKRNVVRLPAEPRPIDSLLRNEPMPRSHNGASDRPNKLGRKRRRQLLCRTQRPARGPGRETN
jgi:hypothetical protein